MHRRPLLFALLLLFSFSAAAQRHEVAVSLGRSDLNQLGDGPAFGASYNRYWTRMFSTRAGLFAGGDEIEGGEIVAGAYHLSAEFHPLASRLVSPWIGAGGALAVTSLESAAFERSESQLTGIYSAGIDVNVTRRFAFGAEAYYLNYEVSLGNRFGYTVDPVTIAGTARFRW